MAALGLKLRAGEDGVIMFRCPACDMYHHIKTGTGQGPRWTFDGNVEAPTFMPSVKVSWGDPNNPGHNIRMCHFFVKAGQVKYLTDCSHEFAGQTVDLPNIEGQEAP